MVHVFIFHLLVFYVLSLFIVVPFVRFFYLCSCCCYCHCLLLLLLLLLLRLLSLSLSLFFKKKYCIHSVIFLLVFLAGIAIHTSEMQTKSYYNIDQKSQPNLHIWKFAQLSSCVFNIRAHHIHNLLTLNIPPLYCFFLSCSVQVQSDHLNSTKYFISVSIFMFILPFLFPVFLPRVHFDSYIMRALNQMRENSLLHLL